MTQPFSQELQTFLSGRKLLLTEIPFPKALIQKHLDNNFIASLSGITQNNKPQCERCGNTFPYLFAQFPCANCQTNCTYCRNCLMMGRVSTCTPLYHWIGPPPEMDLTESVLEWSGTLSPGQQTASKRVIAAVYTRSELLVWAV